jgi:hypothetical protein
MGDSKEERKAFWIGVVIGLLFLFSAADIFLLISVPKFKQIFQDALPGKPLPTVTEFFISARLVLLILAIGRPTLAYFLVRLRKPYAIVWITIGTLWTILEFATGVVAMFMPMEDTGITGMSDSPHP